jgi:hypothetical protein
MKIRKPAATAATANARRSRRYGIITSAGSSTPKYSLECGGSWRTYPLLNVIHDSATASRSAPARARGIENGAADQQA